MNMETILKSHGPDLYEKLLVYIQDNTEQVRKGNKLSLLPAFDITSHVVEEFNQSSDLLEQSMTSYDSHDLYKSHVLNVAILALKMASDMDLSDEEIQDTLLAGLYHDVGFGKIMDSLQYEGIDIYLEDAKKKVLEHPEHGYNSILFENNRVKRIAEIIIQHHERADGSGYPHGLEESEQLVPARIIAIIDTYESLIHPRPYRDALVPLRGIKVILEQKGTTHSENLIKALIGSFSIYPVGHFVRLNTNQVGKVIKTYPDNPVRPDVQIFFDRTGKKLGIPKVVKLKENHLVNIEECVPGLAGKMNVNDAS